ncbi:MAG: DNA-binding response regulator [Chloroflexi bacterium HGW-Chloroflexi-10]|nr:MAG: DNA-binding response regulator [Chloroflexi bacterium HGW-Chloroflexi-10]
MEDKISLLLVDDHSVVRLGLKAYFNSLADIHVIGEAASGEEAVRLAQELHPHIVLMDLIMPGMDGVEATRAIKKVCPATQVIVLTSYHEDEHIFPAIRAGALSYVLKDIDPDELAAAVRRAHTGEAIINPQVAARMVKELRGGESELGNPFQELTERELDVLRLLAAGKNNLEIASELVISEKTVKTHLTNLLSKLHLENRTQAAVYAWQTGVVRRDQL